MQKNKQVNCRILVDKRLKECEVMLQLKHFLFEVHRDDGHTSFLFQATEVTEEQPDALKSRSYVTSFTSTLQISELYDLTTTLPITANHEERCVVLLERAMLVPTSSPCGRMNKKGNLTLSFEESPHCSSFLLAKVSRRVCSVLYIIEVVAELDELGVESEDAIPDASMGGTVDENTVLAMQPCGRCQVVLRFKLYDPLSSLVLQTAAPLTLDSSLEERRQQVYSAMDRLHVVESDEGRAAVLRYTQQAMKMSLSEAPHSRCQHLSQYFLPLTIGLSCREGKTSPLLLIHAVVTGDEGSTGSLSVGAKFLFHPLICLPAAGTTDSRLLSFLDKEISDEALFEELCLVLDDLCIVCTDFKTSVTSKEKLFEWELWHPSQSLDVKVSHFSRKVQSARALDYAFNKSASDGV